MSDIENRVVKVVAGFMEIDPQKIKMDSRFATDLGLDSLDQVEIITNFEKEFKIEIPDSAAESLTTVADAVKYIKEHTEAKS
jgi:acyl carrier protein